MNEELIQTHNESQEKRRVTSNARAELKAALLEYALQEDKALFAPTEERFHSAQIDCLAIGLTPPEIQSLIDHWTRLLYAGHFRRTG